MFRNLHSTVRNMSSAKETLIYAPKTYQYTKGHLSENEVNPNPFLQFNEWFKHAQEELRPGSDVIPESTVFSTARLPSGRVSSRVVLMKELDLTGFVVYSNWGTSKKSKDVDSNKFGAMTFFWPHIQRQVRVEGLLQEIDRETTQKYYSTRPRGSKIGAWASPQSEVIASRDALNDFNKEYEAKFADYKDEDIPAPENWGGIRLVPLEIEFWQGGKNRLHDRITFRRDDIKAEWEIFRLAP